MCHPALTCTRFTMYSKMANRASSGRLRRDTAATGFAHSESSQANRSASRFHLGGLAGRNLGIDLLQSLPLRLQIRLGVMVGRIQLRMPQPASNHSDIY